MSEAFCELVVCSFGHAHGPLRPAPDLLLDARKLPSPPRQCRKMTGLNRRLQNELMDEPAVRSFVERALQRVAALLEARAAEVRDKWVSAVGEALPVRDVAALVVDEFVGVRALVDRVRVAVMCERGLHRSVAVAEVLAKFLRRAPCAKQLLSVSLEHRDCAQAARGSAAAAVRRRRGGLCAQRRGKVAVVDEE
jgi:RNase adaptor protein for sRNA GlmZ degradation